MQITEKHAQLLSDASACREARASELLNRKLKRILKGLGIVVAVLALGFAVFWFTTGWKMPSPTVMLLFVIAVELGEINRKLGKASK